MTFSCNCFNGNVQKSLQTVIDDLPENMTITMHFVFSDYSVDPSSAAAAVGRQVPVCVRLGASCRRRRHRARSALSGAAARPPTAGAALDRSRGRAAVGALLRDQEGLCDAPVCLL